MKFVCDKCGAQYKIRDEKIGPNGVSVRCKKCDNKIIVHLPSAQEEASQFPSFPTQVEMPAVSRDQEATRQLSNPLSSAQSLMEAEGGANSDQGRASARGKAGRAERRRGEKPAKSSIEERSAAEAISSAAVAAFSQNVEREGASISSLPFDLGLEDEEVGKAIESVIADKPPEASPFAAASFGTDGENAGFSGFEADPGNSTRVVNLHEMASLMKNAEPTAPSQPPEKVSQAPEKPSAPGEDWFVAIDGEQQGPMGFEAIKALWDKGDLSPDSLVWNTRMSGWEPLSAVPELAKKLEPPKPPLSDPPKPRSAQQTGGLSGEWGEEGGSLPAAASLPSPQAAPEDTAWKPSAASMLSSLIQDEISALDNKATSVPPTATAQPSLTTAPPQTQGSSLLPALAPLPSPPPAASPATLPQPEGFLPDMPSQEVLQPPVPPDSYAPEADSALGSGLDFPEDTSAGTAPNDFDDGDAAGPWEQPLAAARPAKGRAGAERRQRPAHPQQGQRRQPGRKAPPQPLPQMPSQTSGAIKWICLGIGIAAAALLGIFAIKSLQPQPPAVANVTPPVALPQPPAPPAAPPVAAQQGTAAPPSAALPPGEQALQQGQELPAAAAKPSEVTPPNAAASAAVAETPEPAKPTPAAKPEPKPEPRAKSEPKRIARAEPRREAPARQAPPRRPNRAGTKLDDDFDSDDSGEEVVAEAPRPAPAPASKIDDDFERLFGGGGDEPEPAKPAQKRPTVYVPPPTGGAAKASLSQSDIMGEVMKSRSAIKRCTDASDESGTIVMMWSIQQSGRPINVKTDTAAYRGSDLEACLKGVIQGMKFPAYSGPQMQPIRFPFKF